MDQAQRMQKEQQHLLLQVIQLCMLNGIQQSHTTQTELRKQLQRQ